jgi:hypothetical protein
MCCFITEGLLKIFLKEGKQVIKPVRSTFSEGVAPFLLRLPVEKMEQDQPVNKEDPF